MKTCIKRVLMFGLIIATTLIASTGISAPQRLPHYFPEGFPTTSTPPDQFALWLEFMKATSVCYVPNENASPIVSTRSIKEVRETYGKRVTYNFDPWTREADGKIYFTDYCSRRQVSEAEFNFAKEDLIEQYEAGVRSAFAYYGRVEQGIVKALAKSGNKSEVAVRAELARTVPELAHLSPPVTFRELQQIPRPQHEGMFVQTDVHFVHAPYYGMVLLNTERVNLTLQGRIIDHLIGKPSVVMHELIHGNEDLQSIGMGEAIDLELLASPHMMLMSEDHISLLFHGYAEVFREQIEVISGFNFQQARREIITFSGDGINLHFNAVKFTELAEKLQEAKKPLFEFYRDVVIPELYLNKIFWTALNNKFGDKSAVFKILLMMKFEQTNLPGGYAKTREWRDAHYDEIGEMAKRAFQASGVAQPGIGVAGAEKRGKYDIDSLKTLMHYIGLDEADMKRLARKYNVDVGRLTNASPVEVLDILIPILRAERNSSRGILQEDMK